MTTNPLLHRAAVFQEFNAQIKALVTDADSVRPAIRRRCCRATGPYPVPGHAALWSLFRLGGRRSPVGDPRQHKKADPKKPEKAGFPAIISYSTHPNAKISLRASAALPCNCSGDMYCRVPTI